MKHQKKLLTVALLVASALSLSLSSVLVAQQPATIKVGILHSLSGTMAISETTLKDTVLMMIEDQNKKGGLLGKKLEAVVVDPARTGRCLPKRPRSFSRKTKSPSYSDAGRPCRASRFCPFLKKTMDCSFILSNTKAKNRRRTLFTRALLRINKQSPQSTT
jgi:urea transport system substrate-binding protein